MMISYGRQSIDQSDIDSVVDVLRSDFLTQGPAVDQFERAVADYCGVKYAVAVCNATSALHIACLAAGVGTGDMLWTSPNTFVASANCARYVGADVDFVDIDSDTYNMSVTELEKNLAQTDKLPKVVVPVHFSGQSCDMERIRALSLQYGFAVIEDASHCIGGAYKMNKIGSCQYSDMAVFSFHPVKIITSGEGGMVLTNDQNLYERLQLYRNHGITRRPELMEQEPDGSWYYEQIDLGFNYRMTDLQAALGASQLRKVDAFVARRRELAARYHDLLRDLPLILPYQSPDAESAWHLYVVRFDFARSNVSKRVFFAQMKERGIQLNLHYIPVHTQPYYRRLGFKKGDYPNSERYYEEAFTLPLYYGLTNEQQDNVVKALREVLQNG